MEKWLPIHGYEGIYEVSDLGNIKRVGAWMDNWGKKRLPTGKYIKPQLKGEGYAGLALCKEGISKQTYFHVIVARAFLGEKPEGKEPNHKNGNKWDNRAENLEYLTHQENCQHRNNCLVTIDRNANGTFKKFHKLSV